VTFLLQSLVAFLAAALLVVWLRRPAHRFGLLDHAGGRKRHGESVPLTGGLSLTLGFLVALSFSLPVLGQYLVLFVSLALLAAVGLLDDLGEVSPRGKLAVQVLAALLMTSWANHFLADLGDLIGQGPAQLRNWGIPLTVFATVAVINGFNMFDGMDGLAGGLVFVVLGFFAGFAGLIGDGQALKFLVVLLGAVAGFLVFNLPPPLRVGHRTFLGDTGSLILGFVVAWFSVDLTQRATAHVPPVVMLWTTAVVLFDVFTVTVRRLVRRRDPALPDRGHLHHLLMRRGYSQCVVLGIILGAQALLATVGLVLWRGGAPEVVSFALFLAAGGLYVLVFFFPGRYWRMRRNARSA
jgi:UDP-GlcNAc:undecaprenyl-phosphate GlcNAc-1-phosphate transferase